MKQSEAEDKTKILINVLPRLITKHQSDPARCASILEMVKALKVETYLDLRKIAVRSFLRLLMMSS